MQNDPSVTVLLQNWRKQFAFNGHIVLEGDVAHRFIKGLEAAAALAQPKPGEVGDQYEDLAEIIEHTLTEGLEVQIIPDQRSYTFNHRELAKRIASRLSDHMPADVVRLVCAARHVSFEERTPDAFRELDRASEAFAGRVDWENQPDD